MILIVFLNPIYVFYIARLYCLCVWCCFSVHVFVCERAHLLYHKLDCGLDQIQAVMIGETKTKNLEKIGA